MSSALMIRRAARLGKQGEESQLAGRRLLSEPDNGVDTSTLSVPGMETRSAGLSVVRLPWQLPGRPEKGLCSGVLDGISVVAIHGAM